jgi:F-type H+-transporting ATPase subunit delta
VLDQHNGVVAANVTTARPIPDDVKNALRDSLSSAAGRTVRLSFVTDDKIIGGIVTQIGSTIFDGSVQGQLERLTADFVNR